MNPKFKKHIDSFDSSLKNLRKASRYNIVEYFTIGKGYKSNLKELGKGTDFKGIYIFWHQGQAVYTGISKKVIFRLRQHIKGATYHSASLPIKILKIEYPKEYKNKLRKQFKSDDIKKGQAKLMDMSISFFPVEDDISLYLLEVYVAYTLECKYNDFETH